MLQEFLSAEEVHGCGTRLKQTWLSSNTRLNIPPLTVYLSRLGGMGGMSGSVSTINLLHAISEEEAVPWPEFNPNRRNSSPAQGILDKNSPRGPPTKLPKGRRLHSSPKTTSSYHAGTPTSGKSVSSGTIHYPIRVARSLGLASSSPSSNDNNCLLQTAAYCKGVSSHPGVTQSDNETVRLVGVVTSPLALKRRKNNSNRLRDAQSFIQNSRENSSRSVSSITNNNSTNKGPTSTNTLSSSAGGGCVRVRVPLVSSSPRKLKVDQHQQHHHQQHQQQHKPHEQLQHQQHQQKSSTEEDSDTCSMRSAGFGDYLKALSACPRLSDSSAPSSRGASPMRSHGKSHEVPGSPMRGLRSPTTITTSRRRLRSTTSECEELAAAGKKRTTDFRVSRPVNNFPGSREGGTGF